MTVIATAETRVEGALDALGLEEVGAAAAVAFLAQHSDSAACACATCLMSGDSAALDTSAAEGLTGYTDAIDWGGQAVDSGEVNADGDMVIEYYFVPGGGTFLGLFPILEWTDYEKGQMEEALATYEAVIDVDFQETTNPDDAEFSFHKVNAFGLFLGVMFPPGESGAGDAGFNAGLGAVGWDQGDGAGNPATGGLEQGGFGFITLIHEVGHGLGLAHPHDTGGGSTVLPGVSGSGDTGDMDLNQGVYTTMSYVDGWATHPDGPLAPGDTVAYGYQGTPMAVDIALLQEKYGANEDYRTGDDVYVLPDQNAPGTFFACIWDAGGTDEIRHDGDQAAVIDLRPATLELEEGGGGWISFADGIYGGYTIANGVVIENATGGSGNDALVGNAADNELTGRGGADTFVFTGEAVGFDTITDFEDGADVIDVSGVVGIYPELQVSDVDVSADADGTSITVAGQGGLIAGVAPGDLGFDDFVFV